MERGAFLNRPVSTTAQLVNELKSDPVVLKRYEKHFLLSKSQLIKVFESLHVEPLTKTKRYLAFGINGNYRESKHWFLYHRGELVFADSHHRPIIKRSCGNPMVTFAPLVSEANKGMHTQPVASAHPATEVAQPSAPAAPLNVAEQPANPVVPLPAMPEATTQVAVVAPPSGFYNPDPAAVTNLTDLGPVSGGGSDAWALGVLAGAGAIALADHGGSSGKAPVPEPTTILGLGVGAAFFARKRKARA
jgi:hypothetical protein